MPGCSAINPPKPLPGISARCAASACPAWHHGLVRTREAGVAARHPEQCWRSTRADSQLAASRWLRQLHGARTAIAGWRAAHHREVRATQSVAPQIIQLLSAWHRLATAQTGATRGQCPGSSGLPANAPVHVMNLMIRASSRACATVAISSACACTCSWSTPCCCSTRPSSATWHRRWLASNAWPPLRATATVPGHAVATAAGRRLLMSISATIHAAMQEEIPNSHGGCNACGRIGLPICCCARPMPRAPMPGTCFAGPVTAKSPTTRCIPTSSACYARATFTFCSTRPPGRPRSGGRCQLAAVSGIADAAGPPRPLPKGCHRRP